MSDDFKSSEPIYLQLAARLCRQIVRGERAQGEKLPSVRDLGLQVGVNPNTVQRVYAELERQLVVETKRGQGTFVTDDSARLQRLREELMTEQIVHFLTEMREMGFTPEEIIAGVEAHLRRTEGQSQ